jgi:hypothetical protein
MSAPGQSVQFVWKDGITFAKLSKCLLDYFAGKGMLFMRQSDMRDGRSGLFHVTRVHAIPQYEFPHGPWESVSGRKLSYFSEFADAPWEDDPWPKPDIHSIGWVVLEGLAMNRWWASFLLRIENSLRYFSKSMPTKVHHMLMTFDGDFYNGGERPEAFDRLCRKYHQAKELYQILDCDEAFAEPPHGADEKMRQQFPLYRYLRFRVAKEGTQVLVKRMEERRPMPELDWLHSRIFIDPPGVQALSPEEYARRAGLI